MLSGTYGMGIEARVRVLSGESTNARNVLEGSVYNSDAGIGLMPSSSGVRMSTLQKRFWSDFPANWAWSQVVEIVPQHTVGCSDHTRVDQRKVPVVIDH